MATRSCDVLIVGGGPAGSACARQLARAGLDVLIIDKQEFPRDKVCAGWITPAVVESLELDCAEYSNGRVMQPICGFRTGIIGGTPVETQYPHVASFGIRRREFDDYLLRRSGARLRLGPPLRDLVREDGTWRVNGDISTPLVVVAGGHFCPVARAIGARHATEKSAAVETIIAAQEIEFPLTHEQRSECRINNGMVDLYFCADLKGYGWCFAKGNYLNIGLGREDNRRLPEHVEQFHRWLQLRGDIPRHLPGKFAGHAYLSYPASHRPLVSDGVILIGDAAGLAYPQSGEGILPAVESGLLAAQAILGAAGDYRAHKLEAYSAQLTARYGARSGPGIPRAANAPWPRLAQAFRQVLARPLLSSTWFVRHVVMDRWFLHAN